MCLNNDPEEVLKILNIGKEKMACYKILKISGIKRVKLFSPFRGTPFRIGWNESDCKKGTRTCHTHRGVYEGIHVYKRKPGRQAQLGRLNRIVVCCRAIVKDLIGANGNHLVFKKVYLDKKVLDRTIQKYHEQKRKKTN